ncbi:hypothetical protein OIE62_15720 [Streptomyces scopuliridis]|uniref:Uncharacterized protein n=1 Tax=Streptomyces scopuliridis TaxID=452529 RepID=A0ACD4ZQ88_9ACTN|nr:hypothetical protein [Streptomyces scopuliridis]WSB99967.1 hypothetical protein OG835_25235 [Streptomyces scopuliridis]WSC06334.1 hypothetical protein OIE62_15720 [Streptomyces scopuliridis]
MPAPPTAQAPAVSVGPARHGAHPGAHHGAHRAEPHPPPPVPAAPAARPAADPADDVAGRVAFSCPLVPVVLAVYRASFGGTAAAAAGLVAVTALRRPLPRRSERAAARQRPDSVRRRPGRT